MSRGALACATAALVLWGCGEESHVSTPSPTLLEDVRRLQHAMGDDQTAGPLEEVEDALLRELPVRAADLLEAGAIPASRSQLDRVSAVPVDTEEGRALRQEAVSAYEARVAALESYRDALSRGAIEDLVLVDALSAQRAAEESILALHQKLEASRPLREQKAVRDRIRAPRRE